MGYEIKQIENANIQCLITLANEAKVEGFKFVQRAIDEWADGTNSFSNAGEVLFGVFDKGKCVAIGGLNIDPYSNDPNVGRVRHLYVSPGYRRRAIATGLLELIIERAKKYFRILRLSAYKPGAANPEASKLYEEMGFVAGERSKQTHVLYFK